MDEYPVLRLFPGEQWTDAIIEFLAGLDDSAATIWREYLNHITKGTRAKEPSFRWRTKNKEMITRIGREKYFNKVSEWLALVRKPQNRSIDEKYEPLLIGLAWSAGMSIDERLIPVLSKTAGSLLSHQYYGSRKGGKACLVAIWFSPFPSAKKELIFIQKHFVKPYRPFIKKLVETYAF